MRLLKKLLKILKKLTNIKIFYGKGLNILPNDSFELLLFLVSISVISLSLTGYGSLLSVNEGKNLFLDIFLGFIIVSLIVTLIHFFIKIDPIISILILIFGLILLYRNNYLDYSALFKKNLIYLLIILFFYQCTYRKSITRTLVTTIFHMH